MDNSTSIRQI